MLALFGSFKVTLINHEQTHKDCFILMIKVECLNKIEFGLRRQFQNNQSRNQTSNF